MTPGSRLTPPPSTLAVDAGQDEARRDLPPPIPRRILLPVGRAGSLPGILRFALQMAEALDGEVVVVHVVTPTMAQDGKEWSLPVIEGGEPTAQRVKGFTLRADTISEGILEVARDEQCDLILMAWRGDPRNIRNKLGHIVDPVVEDAPCDVLLIKGEFVHSPGEVPAQRILLATAGGTNAVRAAQLAYALARSCNGTVTLVTVVPEDASAEEEVEARRRLNEIVAEAGIQRGDEQGFIEERVIRNNQVISAIIAAAQNHDIVFLGASGDTVFNQLFIGSVTQRLVKDIHTPVVVVRTYRGLTEYWVRRLWRNVDQFLPQLTDEERLDTYKRVRRGARATADFYILILLSVIIATMGLLLNSSAVIIGAMLVAPLMLPILGLGLGVVMGDTRLLRVAGESTLLGALVGVVISAVFAWAAPIALFTLEIEGRTQPNLYDLTVALAAGAAGAYSISRKNVGAALPGVAIAAALVPPLSVIGITLATQRWTAAAGATLLFGTNLIAISLAGAVVYLLLGFFPQVEEQSRKEALRRGFLVTLTLLFLVSIPLAQRLEQDVNQAVVNRSLRDTLENVLSEHPGLSLFTFEWTGGGRGPIELRAILYADREVSRETVVAIDQAVTTAVGREVQTRLVIIPTSELQDVVEQQVEE